MNERTNPRDITSQASSSAAAPQEHGAHGIKPVAAPMVPAGAQPSVVVKARATNTLRPSDELLDALSDESTLINDTEAADPAPIPAVDPAPVVAEVAGAAATTTAPAALDAAGAGAATTGAAAASTAAETTAATAGATAAGTATATGSFFSTTAGIATMAGGGVVVLGAAAGGGSKAAPAPTPAPVVAPTAPTVALATDSGSNPTDKITNNGALSLSNLATGATVEYRLDTGSWTSVTATNGSATVPTPTTDGAHTIEVRQTTSGGQSPISTITFTLDTQAPAGVTPVLANGATTLTNSAALAAITPAAGATVEYRVDGGTWGAYTAPSAQGAHTVEARQVDVAGNASAISTASFTLDTVAPAAPVVALANNATTLTNSAVLTTVTPEAGATVEYRVDGSNWATTYTAPTGNTAHTVDVRQTDAAGNISASTTLSFTLDTVAPASVTPTLANGATTLTNNAALTALPATEVGATVEYRVDGGAWGAYTAPAAQGAHTVEARQVDAAGNASAASAPLAFTLDTQAPVAPTLALVNGAAAGTTTNNGSVSVSGVEVGATVEYQVNASGTWLPLVADAQGAYNVPSPTVPGLSYTVDVRQTDAAGNVSTSFGSINFTLSSAGSAPTVGLVNDTGASGTDLITSIAQLKITPAANTAPNSTVIEYSTDGGRTWGPSFTPTANAVNVVEVRYNNP
ncbi:MAG: Ig-like domain-containing protein, partial [Leptothrix ochracea]|uniref:Ig-like domain-containing protein n=2 Tax=Leptothrix ochracea TaxID=735331 RepID=UPI0034E26097